MQDKPNDLLLLTGKVLATIMQALMAIGGVVLIVLTPVLIAMQDQINAKLIEQVGEAAAALPLLSILGLFGLGLAMVGMAFIFFGKLRAIIGTVSDGDPFAPENADRLNLMAWLMLGMQLLVIPGSVIASHVADWAQQFEDAHVEIGSGLDINGILMIILLFILARIFKHGTAMQADLEGTV
jgi:hypothetical protein